MCNELTQDRLKELLAYDPATGIFRWCRTERGWVAKDREAGSLHSEGYIHVKLGKRSYGAHRLAFLYMTGAFPPDMVDHINGDRADNRWQNLRPATRSQNGANRGVQADNRLGVKGVRLSASGRYVARVNIKGKTRQIGTFDTIAEAMKAYANAANTSFGPFARAV